MVTRELHKANTKLSVKKWVLPVAASLTMASQANVPRASSHDCWGDCVTSQKECLHGKLVRLLPQKEQADSIKSYKSHRDSRRVNDPITSYSKGLSKIPRLDLRQ